MNKLTAAISTVLLTASVNASAQDYSVLNKQLGIMSDIIKSSVAVQDGRKQSKISSIDATYLAGQGVVFTISSGSRNRHWGNYNFNFTMPTLPPMPVKPAVPHKDGDYGEFEQEIEETVSQALESAAEGYERAIEIVQRNRGLFRELQEEQRDIAYEIRDLERESRDLEFQMRRADNERKKELEQEKQSLAKQKMKLEEDRKVLDAKLADVRKQQAEKQKAQAQERASFYKDLTLAIGDTLCLYGNGLKALPKDENVSVILKSAGDKVGNRYKDQIFVFSKKDINSCAVDKINVAKLMDKSKSYQF